MAGVNPQTGLFDINYNAGATQSNFGFGAQQSQAPQLFGGFGMGSNTPNPSSFNLSTTNFDPSISMNNFGFQTPQANIDPTGSLDFNSTLTDTPQVQAQGSQGFFGDMSGGDMFNFGAGLLQTGIGAYFANQQLDQGQQSLDLSQQKYDDYLADKKKLDSVSADRANNAVANSITGAT